MESAKCRDSGSRGNAISTVLSFPAFITALQRDGRGFFRRRGARRVQRLNAIIFAHLRASATVFPFCCFAEKLDPLHRIFSPRSLLRSRFPPGRSILRENPRAPSPLPNSRPVLPALPPYASAAVRHGLNGETRRSERDTLPLFQVPPRVGAGETTRYACACVHSRVLLHPRYNITYSLTTGYGGGSNLHDKPLVTA